MAYYNKKQPLKISGSLLHLTAKSLAESMGVNVMLTLARKLMPNYDLHKRTGFPSSIPIPNLNAARQIVNDMKNFGLFPQLIYLLIETHYHGLKGRRYTISYLDEILQGIAQHGLIYDRKTGIFIEDPTIKSTMNWGTLVEGEEYILTFLYIDMVSNSQLVREHDIELINGVYSQVRNIIQKAATKRNGRIWSWEGDGGLLAFNYPGKNQRAALCAIDILHRLFIYNLFSDRLHRPVGIRLAVHSGPYEYTHDQENLKNSETIKHLMEMESKYTLPDSLTISRVVMAELKPVLANQFIPVEDNNQTYYTYRIQWEK
ncbi:MAG: hypothetical protein ACOC7U_07595 [Spirochaetota bacterium]